MSRRTEMIGSTLQQELMSIIMRELNDPRIAGLPSITRVKVSEDLSNADIYVTIMGTPGKQTAALNALKHSAGMMRQKLQKTLPMRTIPYLKFHIDEQLKKEIDVLKLIDQANEEDRLLREAKQGVATPGESEQTDAQPVDSQPVDSQQGESQQQNDNNQNSDEERNQAR